MDFVSLHYRCIYLCIDINIAHDKERYTKRIRQRDPHRPVFTFVEELRHVPIPEKYEATSGKEETTFKAAQRGAGKKGWR